MKRLNLLLVFFICIVPENVALAQKATHSAQPKTWQEQLEYVKNRSSVSTSIGTDMNSIRWVGYTYKGRIKTETEKRTALERIFSDSSYIVRYIGSPNFDIIPIKTIRQESKALGIAEDIFANIKSQLEDSVRIGMELIYIAWSYKGKTYYSTAIASNDHGGILYENIGYNILETTESEKQTTDRTSINSSIKTKVPESDSNGGIVSRSFYRSDSERNIYGMTLWSYKLNCTSYFKEGVLHDRVLSSSCESRIGWCCQAGLQTVSGDIGVSEFHEFAWAYVKGFNINVSIRWNGSGFSMSGGGGHAASGTEVHRTK